jgi:hypothetical protein
MDPNIEPRSEPDPPVRRIPVFILIDHDCHRARSSFVRSRDTIRVQVFDASLHRSVRNRTVTVVLPEPFGPAMTSKTGFIAARLRPFVEHQRGAA